MRTLFNAHYSVPAGSIYYLSAGMIAWSVRTSGLIRNRWFLVASESYHRLSSFCFFCFAVCCLGVSRSQHALFRSYVVINPFSSDLALIRPPFYYSVQD